MKQKIKKLISFLEDNQLELESLVFNKGKLNFQVSENKFQKYSSISNKIVIDDIDKYILPITQEQVNKVINSVVKDEWVFNPLDYGFMYDKNKNCFVKKKRAVNQSVMKQFIMKAKSRVVNESWYFEIIDNIQNTTISNLLTNLTKKYIEEYFLELGVIEKGIHYVFVPSYFNFTYNEKGQYFEKSNNNCVFVMFQDSYDGKWFFKKYYKGNKEPSTSLNSLEFKTFKEAEMFLFNNHAIDNLEKTQTTFDGEKQINIEDEKITDYKFDPLNFYGFRYNERGYFIKERKDEGDKITSTFIMYPSNRESNSKTRWTFKRCNDKGIEITFYGDLTFKSYEQVEQFFFRNGVIKCD